MTAIPPGFFGANPQKKIITFYRVLTVTTATHVLFFESQADLNQRTFHFRSKIEDLSNRPGDNNLHCGVDCVRQHCCAYINKSI